MRPEYYKEYGHGVHEEMVEHPDPTIIIENTGVESLKKTIDRVMVAGMKLYDHDRNAYSAMNAEELEGQPAYMSKYDDAKDVNMKMREIQRRLRNKVRAEGNNPVKPEVNPETGTIAPEKEE